MLSREGIKDFSGLDISVICDLRREDEAAMGMTSNRAPFDCRQAIPIAQGSSEMLRTSIRDPSQNAADRIRFMTDVTRELAKHHGSEYRQLFQYLLEAEGGFLLHCSAGKDRTGFGAALILAALGVDEDTIMQDYLLTNEAACLYEFMHTRMRDQFGAHFDEESINAVGGVKEVYLQAALDEIASTHGSLDRYLEEIGVGKREKEQLKEKLLDE